MYLFHLLIKFKDPIINTDFIKIRTFKCIKRLKIRWRNEVLNFVVLTYLKCFHKRFYLIFTND